MYDRGFRQADVIRRKRRPSRDSRSPSCERKEDLGGSRLAECPCPRLHRWGKRLVMCTLPLILVGPAAHAQRHLAQAGPVGLATEWMLLRGTVVDQATNSPISGVQVTVIAIVGAVLVQTLHTDAEGHFQASVVPSTYHITVQGNGYDSAEEIVSSQTAGAPIVVNLRKASASAKGPDGSFASAADLKASGKALKALQKGLESLQKNHPEKAKEQFRNAIAALSGLPRSLLQAGTYGDRTWGQRCCDE